VRFTYRGIVEIEWATNHVDEHHLRKKKKKKKKSSEVCKVEI